MRPALRRVLPDRIVRTGRVALNAVISNVAGARFALRSVKVPKQGIFLNYAGQANRSENDRTVHGGRVKLQHLMERFPETEGVTNLLYLVSSAAPAHADRLIDWAQRKGIKVVLNQNGVAYPAWAGEQYLDINENLSVLHGNADFVVYQGKFCRESAEHFLRQRKAGYEEIPNCVDIDRFRPPARPLQDQPLVLLAAGTHQQPGRVLVPLQVVSLLKQHGHRVRLIVAGRMEWENADEEVRDCMVRLNLQDEVEFVRSFTQDEAPGIYQKAHALIHLKYKDPCPTVVIEAMACGVPVVGSASGGMTELVNGEAGVLLDVEDTWDSMPIPGANLLADAVIHLMKNRALHSQCARSNAVTKFGHHAWLDRHERIFRNLVGT